MSAIVRRNDDGVVLRYEPNEPLRQQTRDQIYPSDKERADLVAAEMSWRRLHLFCEVAEFSEDGMRHISDALERIRRALRFRRRELGMEQPAVETSEEPL